MSKSGRPRAGDVRRALRVVGECRDLGYDPAAWRPHACRGLTGLLGARVVAAGEWRWRRPGPIVPVDFHQVGLTPDEHARYFVPAFRGATLDDDVLIAPVKAAGPARQIVMTRRRHVPEAAWRRCRLHLEYHEPVGVDHCGVSVWELPGGRVDVFGLHRDRADADFTDRELAVLRLFHEEVGRLVGPVLVPADDPRSPAKLPPRVRQVLRCLLDGDSEKQVAARLGLSGPTAHQYVTALYRHYGVASRAELMARFVRRPAPPPDPPAG